VVALGNPFGDEVTASVGIISATGRGAQASLVAGPAQGFRTFLQLDARIHRGNSGGPVLDAAGNVVGIATATGDRPGEVSFAVPINRVREVLDALRDRGSVARSWLGAQVLPVTADRARDLALPEPRGALITEVRPGSPAARAALRAGDVLVTWDGKPIDDRSLPWIVAATPVGKPIAVELWRSGGAASVTVTTEPMPQ
jgi:serine protease Do